MARFHYANTTEYSSVDYKCSLCYTGLHKSTYNQSQILKEPLLAKIQQTKMLVTCQRFGDWFLFGLVWPYSSNQKNIIKVCSKSLLLTRSSNKL